MINFPRELSAKPKYSFINIKSLIMSIVLYVGILKIVELLSLIGSLKFMIYIYSFVVCVILVIPVPFLGDSYNILLKSIEFIFKKISKDNYLINEMDYMEVEFINKNGEIAKEERKIKLTENQVLDKTLDYFDIHEVLEVDNVGYIKGEDSFSTYLKIELKQLPNFQKDEEILKVMSTFNKILCIDKSMKIFNLNSPVKLNVLRNKIDKLHLENPHYESFYNLKREQINNAEDSGCIDYYLEIRKNTIEEIEELLSSLYFAKTELELWTLDRVDIIEIIDRRQLNSCYTEIYQDYTFNKGTNKFESYIRLNKFEPIQQYLGLQSLFSSGLEVSMRINRVLEPNLTLDLAMSEIETRSADKRRNLVEKQVALQELDELTRSLKQDGENGQKLVYLELIVKLEAETLKELYTLKSTFKTNFNELGTWDNGYFQQYQFLTNFYSLKNSIISDYIVPTKPLSQLLPFNYISVIQEGGLIKNSSLQSLNILNPTIEDERFGINSYNKIVLADTGGGKSIDLKQEVMDNIAFYGGKSIVIDLDDEYSGLANEYGGEIINFGVTTEHKNEGFAEFNPLVIESNESSSITGHCNDIADLLQIFYPNESSKEIIKIKNYLRQLYDNFKIKDNGKREGIIFPTFKDLYDLIPDFEENIKLVLGDFINSYPYMQSGQKTIVFSSKLTTLNFSRIKDKPIELRGIVFWVIRALNEEMRSVKRDYILKIIIDESHRFTDIDSILIFILKMFKESRKYGVSLTIADQLPKELIDGTNGKKNEIFDIAAYKMLFKMDQGYIAELVKKNLINEGEAYKLSIAKPGQGIMILKDGTTVDYYSKVNDEFLDICKRRYI